MHSSPREFTSRRLWLNRSTSHRWEVDLALLWHSWLPPDAALFFWRFTPILRNHSSDQKKTADFSRHPPGRRVWDFVWEVLCQAKVIRQRPVPGLAHAFVFWGFLAFALVSLNHLANGLRLGFLSPSKLGLCGTYSPVFAAASGRCWLRGVDRRAVRSGDSLSRPIWLGTKVSYESGVIAGLIFVLMVSYLAAFFVVDDGPVEHSRFGKDASGGHTRWRCWSFCR